MANQKRDFVGTILFFSAFLLIFGGIGIFFYPNISNYFADKNHLEVIRTYDRAIETSNSEEIIQELEKAKIYNENLAGDPVHDPFVLGSGYALPDNYKQVLNITEDGIMGYIDIPKINIYLPIYHGTSEEVLEKGVGHIQNTSLPIGGETAHSVLTGHTGLPRAMLFTDLDKLNIGDIFYIHILNDVLTYEIFETKVILPDKIDELQITKGFDHVTLVTCTPYGVNSHRLLVKAVRTEYQEYIKEEMVEENKIEKVEKDNYYVKGIKIGGTIFFIIVLIIVLFKFLKRYLRNRKVNKNDE